MARTVDTSSTFENWRQNYNDLANDVGDKDALITADKSSIVNAINDIMGQYFFFQDFDFDGSDGASSNTVFSGADNAGNVLQYKTSKVLVYKNGLLLRSGTDYTALNGTSVTLTSSANNSDVIRISSYTGSYTATPSGAETLFRWNIAGDNVWNNNAGGMVIQTGRAIGSIVTSPTVANSIQFDGPVYHNGTITVGVDDTGHDVKFFGATTGKSFLWDESANKLIITGDQTISGTLGVTGETTLATHLNMGDSDIIKLGAGADLQIYHDGSNSYVKDTGTGALRLAGNQIIFKNAADSETMLHASEDGAVILYHDNAVKIATQSDGIEVTGDTDTDTLTVSGNATVGGTLGVTGVATFTAVPVLPANSIDSVHYVDGSIDNEHIADDAIGSEHYAANSVDATAMNLAGNGTSGQVLSSDGDGTFSWTNVSNTNTTYTQEWVDSGDNAILRLNPSTGSDDDLVMVAGSGISLTPSGDNLTITATAASPGDGTITITAGNLIDVSSGAFTTNQSGNTAPTINVDLSELTDMTQSWVEAEDEFVVLDNNVQKRKLSSEIFGAGAFLDTAAVANGATTLVTGDHVYDWVIAQGYTTETGDITGVTAGTGLSGGGTSGTVTVNLSHLGIQSLSDPNADRVLGWDDSAGAVAWFTLNSNITSSGTDINSTDTNTTYSVGDNGLTQNNFTNALKSKLDGIEASATADQSNAEIRTAVEAASDSNVFTDADHTKLNGIASSANNYSLPLSASGTRGGVQIGFTESGKNYPVELSSEKMYVNVPWTDNNTTYSAGTGLALSSTTFSLSHLGLQSLSDPNADRVLGWDDSAGTLAWFTLNSNITSSGTNINSTDTNTTYSVGDGGLTQNNFTNALKSKLDGIAASANNYSLPLAASGTRGGVQIGYSESGKNYPVELSSEKMYVNVPWTDNNTEYSAGSGIGLSSTTFSVAVNASGGSNLTQDANGVSLTATPTFTTVTATGDITSNTSDARLKDVIGIIENPLEKLSKINGYDFTWNETAKSLEGNNFDDEAQVGVMAQEIEEVLPSVVKPSAFEGYNTVQYEKIVPLLIESIKELQKEVESLKDSKT